MRASCFPPLGTNLCEDGVAEEGGGDHDDQLAEPHEEGRDSTQGADVCSMAEYEPECALGCNTEAVASQCNLHVRLHVCVCVWWL